MDQTTTPQRILVVDDNSEAADITVELLSLNGYQAIAAYSGLQGLDMASSFQPDAILLDLGMSGLDGYQVGATLRALPDFDHIAIVAYTAWGDPVTRQRVVNLGFDGHITKPAGLGTILTTVSKAIQIRAELMAKVAA